MIIPNHTIDLVTAFFSSRSLHQKNQNNLIMKILTAQQVKNKMEHQADVRLVMTLGPKSFNKCHIPGSLNIWDIKTAEKAFPKEAEIIVYCSDHTCMSSYYAYKQLENAGFNNIWRFAGGLVEWHQAGYDLANSLN